MDQNYTTLFNAITSAVQDLEKARSALISAQYKTEERYLSANGDKSKILLDRFQRYIDNHHAFDIVETKFGFVRIVNAGQDNIEAHTILNFIELTETLIQEVISDVCQLQLCGPHTSGIFPEEAAEARRRLLPYFEGLDFQDECLETMERILTALQN